MKPNTLSQRRRRLKFYQAGLNCKGEQHQRKARVVIKQKTESVIEPTQLENEWAKLRTEMTTHQDDSPFA